MLATPDWHGYALFDVERPTTDDAPHLREPCVGDYKDGKPVQPLLGRAVRPCGLQILHDNMAGDKKSFTLATWLVQGGTSRGTATDVALCPLIACILNSLNALTVFFASPFLASCLAIRRMCLCCAWQRWAAVSF